MYHTGKDPLHKVSYKSEGVDTVKDPEQRKLHKALLRYHDPHNWPLLRSTLNDMGRGDLIGDAEHQLIPAFDPAEKAANYKAPRRKNSAQAHKRRKKGKMLTQHTGLPPRKQD